MSVIECAFKSECIIEKIVIWLRISNDKRNLIAHPSAHLKVSAFEVQLECVFFKVSAEYTINERILVRIKNECNLSSHFNSECILSADLKISAIWVRI